MLYFQNFKLCVPEKTYKTTIKLIFLYSTAVINFSEFTLLCSKALNLYPGWIDHLMKISQLKLHKRKNHTLLNKPLSEFDFTSKHTNSLFK